MTLENQNHNIKFLIIGAGGIGSFYGARLIEAGNEVLFIARGKQLKALQGKGLNVSHRNFVFDKPVNAKTMEELSSEELKKFDAVLITTKSNSTDNISKGLAHKIDSSKVGDLPYFVSLQNGVENERIMLKYLPKEKVIGGLCRKLGSHIIQAGVIEATGNVETFIGTLDSNENTTSFVNVLNDVFNVAQLSSSISENILLELWRKLIINNGVNVICALLRIKTGELMSHPELTKIVLGMMKETAIAAKVDDVNFTESDVIQMFELIQNFDSIKPSMLVDIENNKAIELDEISNIVVRNCDKQGIDAPYTRTIASLLSYTYTER
jgi:2-dehydropantoate 2-reductase